MLQSNIITKRTKTNIIFKKSIRETFINLKSQYKNTRNPTHQEVFFFKL